MHREVVSEDQEQLQGTSSGDFTKYFFQISFVGKTALSAWDVGVDAAGNVGDLL